MTWPSLCCVFGSTLLLLAFLAAVVFVDPAAYFGSEDLDFCALTSVFFTLNMLPLVFLLFYNDAKVCTTGPISLTVILCSLLVGSYFDFPVLNVVGLRIDH